MLGKPNRKFICTLLIIKMTVRKVSIPAYINSYDLGGYSWCYQVNNLFMVCCVCVCVYVRRVCVCMCAVCALVAG